MICKNGVMTPTYFASKSVVEASFLVLNKQALNSIFSQIKNNKSHWSGPSTFKKTKTKNNKKVNVQWFVPTLFFTRSTMMIGQHPESRIFTKKVLFIYISFWCNIQGWSLFFCFILLSLSDSYHMLYIFSFLKVWCLILFL